MLKSFPSCASSFVATMLTLVASLAHAQTATYNDAYTIQGFSQPNRLSQVASPTAGIIKTLEHSAGDQVSLGECILQLDDRVYLHKVQLARVTQQATGDLQSAEAELNAKQTRLKRIEELVRRKAATTVELMQAQEDLAVAFGSVQRVKDRLAQAAADYARLLAELDQHSIKAPFTGVIIEFSKEVGEYVGPADAIVCTVAQLDKLSVEFLVPRHFREDFFVDQRVNVLFTVSEKTVPGLVYFISPFPNGETNTFTIKVRVDNSSGELSAGERCQLELQSDEGPAAELAKNRSPQTGGG